MNNPATQKVKKKKGRMAFYALVLLICFTVGVYTTFMITIRPMHEHRAALNHITRHRILTENILEAAFQLVHTSKDPVRDRARAHLQTAITELKRSKTQLTNKLSAPEPPINESHLGRTYNALESGINLLLVNGTALAKLPSAELSRDHPAYTRVEEVSQEMLIPAFENLMRTYDLKMGERIRELERWATVAIALILVSIFGIVLLGFYPLLKSARSNDERFEHSVKRLAERARQLRASRLELDHQLRLSESVLNSIGDGVIVANTRGQVILINPSGARILSRVMNETPTEAAMTSFHLNYQFLQADKKTPLTKEELPLERALKGKTSVTEAYIVNPSEPDHPGMFVTVTGTPIRDKEGAVQGGVVVFRDSTEEKLAFDAIQTSERRYQFLLESAQELFYQVDVQGKVTAINRSFELVTGFKREDWIGKDFRDIVHPDDLQSTVELFQRGLAGERSEEQEFRMRRKDGGWVIVSSAPGTPIYENGEMVGVWGFSRDVTVKKQTEERLRQSEELILRSFNALPGPIGIATLDGKFVDVNEALANMVGLPKNKVIGSTSMEIGIWSDETERNRMIAKLKAEGSVKKVEMSVRIPQGKRDFFGDFELIRLNGENHILGLLSDVTETKLVERTLREAKEAADSANRAKSAFLANISHEIRTPLSAICGYLEMLDGEYHAQGVMLGSKKELVLGYMSRIKYNIKTVIQLIDDLLDISKIEAGKLQTESIEFPLLPELGELLLFLKGQAENKSLRFELRLDTRIPEVITTDPMRLRQLLMNVVGNAIKFTSEGFVRVRFGITPLDSEHPSLMCISVEDSGCGIPLDKQSHLFKPFVQADSSTTRRFGGSGLGLNLSRKLARKLGGDLVLENSIPNEGSSFVITLDPGDVSQTTWLNELSIADIELANAPLTPPQGIRLEGVRVLVVEDGPDNQRVIRHFLTAAGAQVNIASDGQEGIEKATQFQYDVILMDLQMPIMGGYEATARLRQAGCRIPILALTAAAMKDEREQCLKAGCNDYLTKPFEVNALLKMVKHYGQTQEVRNEVSKALEPLYSLYQEDPRVAPIVKGFVSRLPDRMNSLREAYDKKDWSELKKLSHQIKGAAGGYGYPELTDTAAMLEKAAISHDETRVQNLLTEFNGFCERASLGVAEL